MAIKSYRANEKREMNALINDVLADIHKELGETLCSFHACDKCGYCNNEFDC